MEYLKRLEAEGKVFLIQPKVKNNVSRLEKDEDKMKALYESGYADAKECYDELIRFLKE